MLETEIPNLNIFMKCDKVDTSAYSELPAGYGIRLCKRDELELWKSFPFGESYGREEKQFMDSYYRNTYENREESFFDKCLFVVDSEDVPVATCFSWKAYGMITTIHWFKTLKQYEGKGIGRALLTEVMKKISSDEYPVYLHTQPSSFRAIKLYSDFGFKIVTNRKVGLRVNGYEESLPILQEFMKEDDYRKLEFCRIGEEMISRLGCEERDEF